MSQSPKRTRARASTPKVNDAQGTITVRTKVYGEEKESKEIQVEQFLTEPAYVRASAGVTRNLGDYESLRVDVSITMPCYKEQVEDTYIAIADKVADLLDAEVNEYTK